MFKGFYQLTSGMLSQQRRLDVVANNMTNVSTAGYKTGSYTDSTFGEYVVSRVGNKDKTGSVELGTASYILAPSQFYTDYTQGTLEETGLTLDFAIEGDGFFAIQDMNGAVSYTRAGNFSLDDEGYLCLPDEGRVLDFTGEPIRLGTDKISADSYGALYTEQGNYLGQLGVFTFPENGDLTRTERGLFTGDGAQAAATPIHWKTVERSNVDLVQQMVEMITSQRALQSAAQVSKMYDQLMSKATNDLGRI